MGALSDGQLYANGEAITPEDLTLVSVNALTDSLYECTDSKSNVYRISTAHPNLPIKTSVARVRLVLVSGQSLSVGASHGNTAPPSVDLSPMQYQALKMVGYPTSGPGDVAVSESDISGLESITGPFENGESSPAISAALHYCLDNDTPLVILSSGIGGKNIDYLTNGNSKENFRIMVRRAAEILSDYGLTIDNDIVLFWDQGESDANNIDYDTELNAFLDDFESIVHDEISTNATLTFLVDQTNRSYTVTSGSLQHKLSKYRDNAYLCTSKVGLMCNFNRPESSPGETDWTHLTLPGYWALGAHWARALQEVFTLGRYDSFDISHTAIEGNTLTLTLPGAAYVDSDIDIVNNGLAFSSDQEATITDIVIDGRTVTVTLSEDVSIHTNRELHIGLIAEARGQYIGCNIYRHNGRKPHGMNYRLRDYLPSQVLAL